MLVFVTYVMIFICFPSVPRIYYQTTAASYSLFLHLTLALLVINTLPGLFVPSHISVRRRRTTKPVEAHLNQGLVQFLFFLLYYLNFARLA